MSCMFTVMQSHGLNRTNGGANAYRQIVVKGQF